MCPSGDEEKIDEERAGRGLDAFQKRTKDFELAFSLANAT